MKYKIGDLVIHNSLPDWGTGIIIETYKYRRIYLRIFWPKSNYMSWHAKEIDVKKIIY
jgi:hypothetical protein